jgi:hypothetical protein
MEVELRNKQQPEFRVTHRLLVGFAAPHFRFAKDSHEFCNASIPRSHSGTARMAPSKPRIRDW